MKFAAIAILFVGLDNMIVAQETTEDNFDEEFEATKDELEEAVAQEI